MTRGLQAKHYEGGSFASHTSTVSLCYDGLTSGVSNTGVTVTCSGATALSTVNAIRRLTWEGSATSSTSYTAFDPMGRVLNHSQTTGSTYGFQYAYNLNGELELENYPSGRQVRSCYDIAARPNQVQNVTGSSATNYASSVNYTPHGAISSIMLGDGLQENYGYSSDRLQLTSVAASSNLLTLTYGYCAPGVSSCTTNNGNVQSQQMTRPNGTWADSYSYDALNRLTVAQETGTGSWSQGYGYDAFGNRWVTANNGLPSLTNETPTLASQYSMTGNNQIYGWGYDGSGNVTTVGGMSRSFSYDAENRQLTANVAGIATSSYVYDGEGRRVQKTTAWGSTTYVYDAFGQLAAEYGTPDDTGTKYLTADALGSTRLETAVGTSGPVLAQNCDYEPFGAELGAGTANRDSTFCPGAYPSAPSGPNMKFTGKERDAESGLDYFGYRYYSGAQGRWTSPDQPFADQHIEDPQSWNMYAYVRNDPLAHVDPNGKACSALNNSSGFCQRADLYTNLDTLVGSKTRFFAAASAASQELADVAVPGFGAMAASPGTRAFLESTGQALEKVNLESAGQILSGQMTGSEEALDRSMVHREQTAVQKQLDQLKGANAEGYGTAIKEINTLLNDTGAKTQGLVLGGNLLFSTDKAYSTFLGEVRKSLGHNIDFANQKDREAIGNALVQHIRNGGCDVTRDKVSCH